MSSRRPGIQTSQHTSWVRLPASTRGSPRLLLGVLAIGLLQLGFYFGIVLQPWTKQAISRPLYEVTGGFLHPELVMNLLWLGLLLAVLRRGSLTPRDAGLRWAAVRPALWGVGLLWVGAQTVLVVVTVVSTGSLPTFEVQPYRSEGLVVLLGLLAREVVGNSLYEEVLYRGIVLEQVRLHAEAVTRFGQAGTIAVALVVSQSAFALVHVPIRLYQGATLTQTALSVGALFAVGLLFGVVYYRTGNLLVAVGVHALNNLPLFVFGTPAQWPVWLATVGLLVWWPRLAPSRSTTQVAAAS